MKVNARNYITYNQKLLTPLIARVNAFKKQSIVIINHWLLCVLLRCDILPYFKVVNSANCIH